MMFSVLVYEIFHFDPWISLMCNIEKEGRVKDYKLINSEQPKTTKNLGKFYNCNVIDKGT